MRIRPFLALIVFFLIEAGAHAQCVMCKATAQQGEAAGIGGGLNSGILYLAAIPYTILAGFGIYFYVKSRKKSTPDEGSVE